MNVFGGSPVGGGNGVTEGSNKAGEARSECSWGLDTKSDRSLKFGDILDTNCQRVILQGGFKNIDYLNAPNAIAVIHKAPVFANVLDILNIPNE
jgi:phosphoribosylformylglycinamidine (FGAM) synthase-like amidotransferase family enzyme